MFSFWIRKRIFSLITFLLKPVIKFEIEFDDGVSVELMKAAETVYAIPYRLSYRLSGITAFNREILIFLDLSQKYQTQGLADSLA